MASAKKRCLDETKITTGPVCVIQRQTYGPQPSPTQLIKVPVDVLCREIPDTVASICTTSVEATGYEEYLKRDYFIPDSDLLGLTYSNVTDDNKDEKVAAKVEEVIPAALAVLDDAAAAEGMTVLNLNYGEGTPEPGVPMNLSPVFVGLGYKLLHSARTKTAGFEGVVLYTQDDPRIAFPQPPALWVCTMEFSG